MPTTFADEPGTAPIVMQKFSLLEASDTSLKPVVTETGKISLSIDGVGTMSSTGTIYVDKPVGATVRKAYLASADVWGNYGGPIPDGDIKIDSNDVSWDVHVSKYTNNAWSDVTGIVKPIVDGSPAGLVALTITEVQSSKIDGSILAVIFDDPNQMVDNTVILFFGAQDVNGDTFSIALANPVDKSISGLQMDFSLGISYGYQPTGQYSIVDVNGMRLTTSAGGQDDGADANGALITVGGIGDSNENPLDPYATNMAIRYDDELYTLLPFVQDGDSSISIYTRNPSNDDNIFFAALYLTATTAIAGEGIILSPTDAWNPLYTEHTVTAKIQDAAGGPVVGMTVMFEVVTGPNAGVTGMDATDAMGEAHFTYGSSVSGTDVIVASFYNGEQELIESNRVTKTWGEYEEPENVIPEFGLIGASLVLLAAAIFIMKRR